MKICTEADYLQAHLTVIQGRAPAPDLALQIALQRVATRLKKWLLNL